MIEDMESHRWAQFLTAIRRDIPSWETAATDARREIATLRASLAAAQAEVADLRAQERRLTTLSVASVERIVALETEVERLTKWRAALEATENHDNAVLKAELAAAQAEVEKVKNAFYLRGGAIDRLLDERDAATKRAASEARRFMAELGIEKLNRREEVERLTRERADLVQAGIEAVTERDAVLQRAEEAENLLAFKAEARATLRALGGDEVSLGIKLQAAEARLLKAEALAVALRYLVWMEEWRDLDDPEFAPQRVKGFDRARAAIAGWEHRAMAPDLRAALEEPPAPTYAQGVEDATAALERNTERLAPAPGTCVYVCGHPGRHRYHDGKGGAYDEPAPAPSPQPNKEAPPWACLPHDWEESNATPCPYCDPAPAPEAPVRPPDVLESILMGAMTDAGWIPPAPAPEAPTYSEGYAAGVITEREEAARRVESLASRWAIVYGSSLKAGVAEALADAANTVRAGKMTTAVMSPAPAPEAPACPECGHGAEHHLPRKNGEHPCCYVLGDRDWCPCTGGTGLAPKGDKP